MRVRQRAADGAERHDEHACPVREAPNWHGAVDADPVLAEATRRKLFDRVVADKALVFPVPGRWQDRDGWRGLHLRACCIETAIIPQPVAVFDTLFRSAKIVPFGDRRHRQPTGSRNHAFCERPLCARSGQSQSNNDACFSLRSGHRPPDWLCPKSARRRPCADGGFSANARSEALTTVDGCSAKQAHSAV